MDNLFRLPAAARHDPAIEAWFAHGDPLRILVEPWFEEIRGCGPDVSVIMHDGCPTACLGDVAFAYVAAFATHTNIGFFHGASLDDPAGLLEGGGKRMRHVKLRFERMPDARALRALIAAACDDIRRRVDGAA